MMFITIVSPLIISCELCKQLKNRYSMFSFHIFSIIFNPTRLKEFKHSLLSTAYGFHNDLIDVSFGVK